LLTSIQAEFETELNTLREEVASAQTILHNEQLLRTLDQEAAAHAFHQVELFQTENSERIMEARIYQDADPARSQQLEQEIQDMRPRMGELGTAFTRANMHVNETHMQAQNLEFEIRILSNGVLHLQIVCQTIRETLLSLASSVDQAQT
jgi:chromosome segregation ATPase